MLASLFGPLLFFIALIGAAAAWLVGPPLWRLLAAAHPALYSEWVRCYRTDPLNW